MAELDPKRSADGAPGGECTAPRVLLASASPRRAELLSRLGIPFEVRVADLDETLRGAESAEEYVLRVATWKARAVADAADESEDPGAGGFVTLAADTAVVLDGRPLGKPTDAADARRMLRTLSGRSHEVLTAVVVMDPIGETSSVVARTAVRFAELTEDEIEAYVATGEPLDKAGGYGLQGIGAVLIERVEGDPTTVIGLPLRATRDLLVGVGARFAHREYPEAP